MKLFKTLAALCMAGVMALAVTACAPTAKSEGTGGYIDDTVITTKVKSALLADKNIKSREISVETFKGRVQLSGFVSSSADANRAVQVTRGVAGVKSVEKRDAVEVNAKEALQGASPIRHRFRLRNGSRRRT
ncbi:Osmotically-inducible protein Y precursor [Serratia rubidaea]|uniref:Osmotically-inducible protein Y n=1 Tax=Serratia rubidaea TaxID=61652 RepID=A0A4U9HHJ0_SERRU|nr:Osmotically-inducible protein Y precursor [Serratia rubidaea]